MTLTTVEISVKTEVCEGYLICKEKNRTPMLYSLHLHHMRFGSLNYFPNTLHQQLNQYHTTTTRNTSYIPICSQLGGGFGDGLAPPLRAPDRVRRVE